MTKKFDGQKGKGLTDIYELILSKLGSKASSAGLIELGYKEMSKDPKREESACNWIQNANSFGEMQEYCDAKTRKKKCVCLRKRRQKKKQTAENPPLPDK